MRGYHDRSRHWLGALALGALTSVALVGCTDTSALEARVKALEEKSAKVEQAAAPKTTAAAPAAPAAPAGPVIGEYKDYGFSLPVPQGVQVKAAGIGTAAASKPEGQITATAGKTSMVLVWTSAKATPEASVQGAFQVLAASQAAMTFQPLNEGEFKVDARDGAFGAFGALNKDKAVVGVGVIGGWSCSDGRSFALTVAGDDLAQVQSSFAGFTGSFRCAV